MNTTLLELFRQESETQTTALDDGLLVLEREPQHATQLEACMRAAHSLKGAARVVGVESGVLIAHAMEDVFVAAQNGELTLDRRCIDTLLEATDQMRRLGAQPTSFSGDDTRPLIGRLEALLPHTQPAHAADRSSASPQTEPEVPLPAPTAPHALPESDSTGSTSDWIRISAGRITELLDASGKAVIGAHRLRNLGGDLQRLKRQQMRTRRALDVLQEQLLTLALDLRSRALLTDLREQVAESQRQIDAHLQTFEAASWSNTQRAQAVLTAAQKSRMRPFSDLLGGRERMARDLARTLGKNVRLVIEGSNTPVDREVLDKLDAPLTHLLRNAVDHGIETPSARRAAGKPEEGVITLSARQRAGMLLLDLSDDGAGIDLEALRHEVVQRRFASAATAAHLSEAELLTFLFLPGFSMRTTVTEVSGRGVGLDAVQHDLRQVRGNVRLESRPGAGCTFRLEVPLTLSMVRSLVTTIGGEPYAFPLAQIEHMLRLDPSRIVELEGRQHFWHDDQHVGLISAAQLLQRPPGTPATDSIPVVVLRDADGLHGIVVEAFAGEHMLAVVPLDARLGKIQDVAAGALLDDGSPVLVLDIEDINASIGKLLSEGHVESLGRAVNAGSGQRAQRVLVVEDSLTVRELQRKLLASHGYDVEVAVDGMDGWNTLRGGEFDLLITDIDMPRMDGIEFVRLLRREARFASLPVMK